MDGYDFPRGIYTLLQDRLFCCLPDTISYFRRYFMYYYSDPTANQALSGINREFARLEKKAKRIKARLKEGTLSPEALERAQKEYTGIYRHVLSRILAEEEK